MSKIMPFLSFLFASVIVAFGLGIYITEFKVPPYRDIAAGAKTIRYAIRSFNAPPYIGQFMRPDADLAPDAALDARFSATAAAAFPGNILVTGGLNEYLEICPGDGCIAIEIDRAGNIVHGYPYRPDAIFAAGGTQLGRGRGTEMTRLPRLRQVFFVVLKPPFAVSTSHVYSDLKMGLTARAPAANLQVIKPLLARFPARPWFGYNRLEDVVLPAHPELSRVLLRLREKTAVAMLSGSGSAIFGACQSARQAEGLVAEFSAAMEFARCVGPLATGVQLTEG